MQIKKKNKLIKFADLTKNYKNIKTQINNSIFKVINETAFISGKYVEKFEHSFKIFNNSKYCISCANGTDALSASIKALGLNPGEEVITPANSWISSSECISTNGGVPVFADIDKNLYTITLDEIKKKMTSKTRGIIVVHLYGNPADILHIIEFAKKHNIWVIEDCAQAHGASIRGKRVGNFGDIGTFSFFPSKNLGGFGDGGCITTNNKKIAVWLKKYLIHGGKNIHEFEGINSRLDGIQASILDVKLSYLDEWNTKRIKNAELYKKYLIKNANVTLPIKQKNSVHVYHSYTIKVKNRNKLKKYLLSKGVLTNINYPKILPFLPAYKNFKPNKNLYINAYENQNKILCLPMYPELTQNNIKYICREINKFYNFDS